ncbi:hypothetical protein [Pseudoalteromonas sp. SWXJZ10B]|uniref:hypothetical protein n=1 Tax=Pseudoalteromonas sp. SWXJZ10B TaxID=2792063 RepID=UPI0018CCFBF4|nr:hypothetical protein [Pseudoalteromonas sp. SWXJZ10B]MBH0044328.1 hypothetical protein [Pseudoalteromonas sp. SWXJZ10B]
MKYITVILLLSLPFVTLANDVEGGFGYKFKEKINISSLELIKVTKVEGDQYRYKPEKPYGNLDNYSVYVTPETQSVYKIEAQGSFPTKADCKQELSSLEQALSKKYGAKKPDLSAVISGMPIIRLGGNGKRIVGMCNVYTKPYQLTLSYMDDSQTQIAKRERASIINSERDLSGL